MDEIQIMIEVNAHLNGNLEKLEELLAKTSVYWAHMDDENVDYIQQCNWSSVFMLKDHV